MNKGFNFAIWRVALLLSVLFLGVGADRACAADQPAEMTLMVYMTGSNLETEAGIATENLHNMAENMPVDGSLRVVVLASGSKEWHCEVAADASNIYQLTHEGLELLQKGPQASMGDPNTLSRLLEYGASCVSDRYALLLWDHGAGPMSGVCFDERYEGPDGMDGLTMPELASALGKSPFAEKKLEWIGFDACFMASVETAGVIAPFADYMIASQEPEPAEGWDYKFLTTVASAASPVETAEYIIEEYANNYEGNLSDITLSCIDLSYVPDFIAILSDVFGKVDVSTEQYPALAKARLSAQAIGNSKPYPYDLVDLQSLLAAYQDAGLLSDNDLLDRLGQAIVCNYSNHDNRNGLSIYYPFQNKERYISPWSENYRFMNAGKGYQEFVEAFGRIWLGETLADWDLPRISDAESENPNKLFLELEEKQAEQLQSARLVVVSEKMPGEYTFVYSSEDVEISPRGVLSCEYNNEALYFMDENGRLQTGALYYIMQDDGLFLPVWMYNLPGDDDSQTLVPEKGLDYFGGGDYFLYYRKNSYGELELADIMEADPTGIRYNRSSLKLEDWEILETASVGKIPVANPDGYYEPYEKWEQGGSMTGYDFHLKEEELGVPCFLPIQDSAKRYAFFEMTDLQGNIFSSELYPLENPYREEIPIDTSLCIANSVCTINPLAAEAIVSGDEPGIEITFQAENHSDQIIYLNFRDFRFDQTVCEDDLLGGGCALDAGETERFRIFLNADVIQKTGVDYINELHFIIECTDENYKTVFSEEAGLLMQVNTQFSSNEVK